MKILIMVLLVSSFISSASSIEIGSSFSIRNPREENNPVDYEVSVEIHKAKLFYIDLENRS